MRRKARKSKPKSAARRSPRLLTFNEIALSTEIAHKPIDVAVAVLAIAGGDSPGDYWKSHGAPNTVCPALVIEANTLLLNYLKGANQEKRDDEPLQET